MIETQPTNSTIQLAIIGGGASGLAAGIFAARKARELQQPPSILISDQAKSIGAKILVAGGGRCNVTHDVVKLDDYNGSSKNIIRNVLNEFGVARTIEWFREMGVELKTEPGGKLFPITDSAKTVLSALSREYFALGGQLQTGCRVLQITPPDQANKNFVIRHTQGEVQAGKVILAAGGRSLPRSGSDGSGLDLAKRLGHTISETYAGLVPLMLNEDMFHRELSGIAHDAQLTIRVKNKPIFQRSGSLLWTHFGISGPVAMDASRHWLIASANALEPAMECNLLVNESFEDAEKWLIELSQSSPRQSILRGLTDRFSERLIQVLLRQAGIDPLTNHSQLMREQRRKLCHLLTALPISVAGHRGWNYAEVTAGGVPLAEINYRTMESRLVPGLYLVGEILDCDGYIGGYNFQWAWATGFIAGNAAQMIP